ncbi:hypothetical protein [Candidatus Minimicrobia naudis]
MKVLSKLIQSCLSQSSKVEVTTPEEFMGDIIGDLNSRRGRIDADGKI